MASLLTIRFVSHEGGENSRELSPSRDSREIPNDFHPRSLGSVRGATPRPRRVHPHLEIEFHPLSPCRRLAWPRKLIYANLLRAWIFPALISPEASQHARRDTVAQPWQAVTTVITFLPSFRSVFLSHNQVTILIAFAFLTLDTLLQLSSRARPRASISSPFGSTVFCPASFSRPSDFFFRYRCSSPSRVAVSFKLIRPRFFPRAFTFPSHSPSRPLLPFSDTWPLRRHAPQCRRHAFSLPVSVSPGDNAGSFVRRGCVTILPREFRTEREPFRQFSRC